VDEVNLDLTSAREAQSPLGAVRRTIDLAGLVDPDRDQIDARLADVLRTGRDTPGARIAEATARRAQAYMAVQAVLGRHDFLVTPTLTAPPFAVGRAMPERIAGEPVASALEWHPFTFPFNLTGHPSISIPAGWTADGLPVGMQVVGRRFADRELLAVARYVEREQPRADRRPRLPAGTQHDSPFGLASPGAEP